MPLGMEVGLDPGDCFRCRPSSPPTEKGHSSTRFWPMSFVAKRLDGSIQDATWYGGKPRPVRRCIRWGRSYPLKGAQPQFSTHVYCDQTVGWMKTLLGTEIDIGPGHIVLDGDTAPPQKWHISPLFSAPVYCGHGRPS